MDERGQVDAENWHAAQAAAVQTHKLYFLLKISRKKQ